MLTFRAKARAVDLLGKGQIADLPTAICELWKNGYDAYADNLSCNLLLKGYKDLKSPIFILSDDGTGMSYSDIKNKWIVLGTDSRVKGMEFIKEEDRFGKPLRIPMGEKGIGRLSVAYIGSQMLMLTKKKDEDCQLLFMDWRILNNYNLFLEHVEIPVMGIKRISDSKLIFEELINRFSNNLTRGNWNEYEELKEIIENELEQLEFPFQSIKEVLFTFLNPDKHGTVFIVFNPHEQLMELVDGDRIDIKDDPTTNYLRSSLSGISNEFKGEKFFKTSFWIHDLIGKYDLIAKENFFIHDDITNADHRLSGFFNEEGFFNGELQVFNKIIRHTFRPRRKPGVTPYGPFKIEFGFMEGDPKSSKLKREEWDIIKKKLDKFGGLYIYRDKFRVLPYGRTDYDFLKFEERRSLSATYYQFSHRRIFGYIEISRNANPSLKDKAGREGFIVNRAYREFQNDLIEFFIDLSKRYFRTITPDEKEKGDLITLREEQVDQIRKKNIRILDAEKERSKKTAKWFKGELKTNSERIKTIMHEITNLFEELKAENEKSILIYNDISVLITQIMKTKSELRKMKIVKPRRIKLSISQTNKYYEYRENYADGMKKIKNFDILISEIQEKLTKENLEEEFEKQYKNFRSNIETMVKNYHSRFNYTMKNLNSQILIDLRIFLDAYAEKTGHLILNGDEAKSEVEEHIIELEKIHNSLIEEIEEKFESFIRHIESLSFDIDDDLLVGWYKEEYKKINEKVEAMHELAQLGMAIEIIDHQFNIFYTEMAVAIEFFKKNTESNPEVKFYYKQLRDAFEHLENNHQLLTPLFRTMRRSKIDIKGSDLVNYLNRFFSKRFEKHRIQLETKPSFENYTFHTYESIIKPVFINIINNAIYWLLPSIERKIVITYEENAILIMNSGVRIEYADLDRIFTLFFTRKPGGRGIGLYLAKTNLNSIGYDISATNNKELNRLKGACFIVKNLRDEK